MQSVQKNIQAGEAAYPATEAVGSPKHSAGAVPAEERSDELVPNTAPYYLVSKRVMDVAVSAAALAVLSPVMLLTAAAIKFEDPKGRIFYNAPRGGKDGVPFVCHKFRSMCSSADADKASLLSRNEMDGPVFKIRDDPRVTKVGRFIRRMSIDELPQLYDVLRGKMSLVGPRPLPISEQTACTPYQRQRELVKPGLTCYWQISGRNRIPFCEWIELDRKYIKEQNLWTDVKILVKTIPAVFSGGGGIKKCQEADLCLG